ncbi:NADPH:quinone reductase [Dyadobacter frigoris]|nr:NADPH:quinone reductase [Dyadobacter frigoris]
MVYVCTELFKQHMKAIELIAHGGIENLVLTDLPMPEFTENEVLIRVKAISINPADTYIRKLDALDYVFAGERPRIMGWDISGIVVSVGTVVTGISEGDGVFGTIKYPGHDRAGHGKGYAEFVAAPAGDLALKPLNISHAEAVAATLAALTAWQPLSKAGIKPGDRIFITAAGGGVGHFAIQIAKYFGAYVIVLASESKKDFVLSLGADEFIDYRSQKFEEVLQPVDFVLEALREDHIARTIEVVKPGGKLISLWSGVAGTPWETRAAERGILAYYNAVTSSGEDMKEIAALLEKGQIRSHIAKRFALEDIGLAHLEQESDHVQGKLVITFD